MISQNQILFYSNKQNLQMKRRSFSPVINISFFLTNSLDQLRKCVQLLDWSFTIPWWVTFFEEKQIKDAFWLFLKRHLFSVSNLKTINTF